ncbi:hypothetical protein FDUTEX481_07268 [Tolypothrix sp. PCC 7601]|nr:hypothetical protein FDUTEX481_07268 [Tolypothrix sp. PCC 7601]
MILLGSIHLIRWNMILRYPTRSLNLLTVKDTQEQLAYSI